MKIIIIYILYFLLTSISNAKTVKNYNILFLDVEADKRYNEWGIHPVDIRSKLKKEARPLQGANLGIEDSMRLMRLTKTNFLLNHVRKKTYEEALNFLGSKEIDKYKAVLLDLNISNIEGFKNSIIGHEEIIYLNVSSPNNALRNEMCLPNFLNIYPSYSMLTDSISQYLIKRNFKKTLLLTGPLEEDNKISMSFKNSAKKFGIKIIKEKFFVNNNDPRVRDKNNLSYLTKERTYNNIFISDTVGEFSLTVPNATIRPALVSGSSGLVPNAWHWSYLRHGAPQLNGRFERLNNRRMDSKDWAAWIAIKTIVESVIRTQSIDNNKILTFINSEDIQIDGSKGISLNFRKLSNQLRQPILLTSSNNWVTAKTPLEEFKDSKNNLDTIGINFKQTKCMSK